MTVLAKVLKVGKRSTYSESVELLSLLGGQATVSPPWLLGAGWSSQVIVVYGGLGLVSSLAGWASQRADSEKDISLFVRD